MSTMSSRAIAVIGGGHAGVEAAAWLADAGCQVTLFSNESVLPYFRPRLIAVAFGQAAPDAISIKKQVFFDEKKITLRLNTPATEIDVAQKTVNGEAFDGIILTCGARPFVPPIPNAETFYTLWSLEEAKKIWEKCQTTKKLSIIGGGVLGVESAVRAHQAGLDVSLYEVAPHLVNGLLGVEGEKVLLKTLTDLGIHVTVNATLPVFTAEDFVLCSTGARAAHPYKVGADLRVAAGVYAAGDTALVEGERPACAVKRATMQAHLAADNLLAELEDRELEQWSYPILPLFMKVDAVEFHVYGDFSKPEAQELRLDDGTQPTVFQSCLRVGNHPVAVRMVGTRQKFNEWSTEIFKILRPAP